MGDLGSTRQISAGCAQEAAPRASAGATGTGLTTTCVSTPPRRGSLDWVANRFAFLCSSGKRNFVLLAAVLGVRSEGGWDL